MSTIPNGLTAKNMRERIEDKATITDTGSMYVGFNSPVGSGTDELVVGDINTVLCSDPSRYQGLVYKLLDDSAFAAGSLTKNQLEGGVVTNNTGTSSMQLSFFGGANGGTVINYIRPDASPSTTTVADCLTLYTGTSSIDFQKGVNFYTQNDTKKKYYVVNITSDTNGHLYNLKYVAFTSFGLTMSSEGTYNISRERSPYKAASLSALTTGDRVFYGDTITALVTRNTNYRIRTSWFADNDLVSSFMISKGSGADRSTFTIYNSVEASLITYTQQYAYLLDLVGAPAFPEGCNFSLIRTDSSIGAPNMALRDDSEVYVSDVCQLTVKSSPISTCSVHYVDNTGAPVSLYTNYNETKTATIVFSQNNIENSINYNFNPLPKTSEIAAQTTFYHSGHTFVLHLKIKKTLVDGAPTTLHNVWIPEANDYLHDYTVEITNEYQNFFTEVDENLQVGQTAYFRITIRGTLYYFTTVLETE